MGNTQSVNKVDSRFAMWGRENFNSFSQAYYARVVVGKVAWGTGSR